MGYLPFPVHFPAPLHCFLKSDKPSPLEPLLPDLLVENLNEYSTECCTLQRPEEKQMVRLAFVGGGAKFRRWEQGK